MAMTMLNIGLLAVVAAFTSGIWGITRAGTISTASALGDAQMELYRGLPNVCIYMPATWTIGTYTSDTLSYLSPTTYQVTSATACTTYGITPPTNATPPSRVVVGPDHHKYEIDTYVNYRCTDSALSAPTGAFPGTCAVSTPRVTLVSVVVRDGRTPTKVLARQTSLFDASTG
jgi:hypothetical protein